MNGRTKHRGLVPQDLRTAGPSGEVETYFQKESFTWHGQEARDKGTKHELFIAISKSRIRISHAAASAACIEPGDKVKVGINKGSLAIAKETEGFITKAERVKTTKAVHFNTLKLIQQIQEQGFPVPGRLACTWDEKSGMLVARKPVIYTNPKEAQA